MNKTVPFIVVLGSTVLVLTSCKSTMATENRKMALRESKVAVAGCFVEMKDGTIKNYSRLQLMTSVYRAPHLLADGGIKIDAAEILAYQSRKHYAINASGFSYGGHKSNIATETLPGFAVRIATGHLNVYIKKFKANGKVMDEYFLQENEGQVLVYTPELMSALVKNSPEALAFFNNHKKRLKLTRELKLTARIYNNTYFARQAGEKSLLARTDKPRKKTKKF
ncbi:MAG: hypothetical protein ABIT58_04710 [Ferruginibacter sp.]